MGTKNRKSESAESNPNWETPAHLSERCKAIWRSLVPRRAKSLERLTLLQLALESLDSADRARETMEREGQTVTNTVTGVVHVHPASRIEKESRATFMRAWKELKLEWGSEDASRF